MQNESKQIFQTNIEINTRGATGFSKSDQPIWVKSYGQLRLFSITNGQIMFLENM